MKYSEEIALAQLAKLGLRPVERTFEVLPGQCGIGGWGALDFLRRQGYKVRVKKLTSREGK